jgi:hypothetical protein
MPSMQIALNLEISKTSVIRITKEVGLKCYKPATVQELSEADMHTRVTFSENWLRIINDDPDIEQNTLWTDEAMFTLNGRINRIQFVYRAHENPHLHLSIPHKTKGIHVWAGIHSRGIIGPYFFEQSVNGQSYLSMLQDYAVPQLMELENAHEFFWQQDGAPPHWSLVVREYLRDVFGEKWIGRGGPIVWPPRSPDLTPCDFYLWGHLKSLVYKDRPKTLEELRQKIIDCFETITEDHCSNACNSVRKRLELCVRKGGSQISSSKEERNLLLL